MPQPISNCVQQMFAYMAKDIFTNLKETTKRLAKKLLYSFVWNELTAGKILSKKDTSRYNARKLMIILHLYKKGGQLPKQDKFVAKRVEKKLGIVAGQLMKKGSSRVDLCLKLLKYNQVSSLVWKELANGKKVLIS
jgi:hypothetical protein